ncbi:uncharacterized protein LOC131666786 isoform X2 [Phymastichus coffea]|uniref:uncharacterized protein LOC131666786 isoform X2 n=1 Tax=Phymastichus coffea TaxID=108790 RepID=UPI00273C4D89|nr:uncharacterized protein LOC131666786 isoform X2 [Phymastichus coffea]
MSINVTVNGNPISIRRGKMVLSDLENLKKCEREHRKRLRLEQVQEQSRAISKTVLERARQAKKDQLDRLERDENTEMRKAHDKRMMEFHRRYQDIENIGLAHKNAAIQPDIETIRLEEQKRNRVLAKARGTHAMQRLEESKKVVSSHSKQQDRLRKVREFENERSCLVSHIPNKSCTTNIKPFELADSKQPSISTRKKVKSVVSKKSPIMKTPKLVKVCSTQTKIPHVSASVEENNDDNNHDDLDRTLTEENACTNPSKICSPVKPFNDSKNVLDTYEQVHKGSMFESDENEPRKTVPVTSSVPKKSENIEKHSAKRYQKSFSDLSSTSTSSSTISDDSSYFSDNAKSVKKTPRHPTSPASSKISMYDHKTRQRKEYERPPGLVERINVKNVPNAQDLAQEVIELENKESSLMASQKEQSKKQTHDAILREKVKRDYQALVKNLDLLSKEERTLKVNQVASNRQMTAPSKNSENLTRRQKKMDRVFESILRNSRDPATNETLIERPITITPRNYMHCKSTSANEWREPPCIDEQEYEVSCSEEDDEYIRKRKISELLIKIEQLKRQLLQEYGPNLPDDVFNASLRSLFNNNANQLTTSTSHNRVSHVTPKLNPPAPPEIQVINMSSDENIKFANKIVASQCKKFISRPPLPKPTPKTSSSTMTTTTRDQEIQVEMEKEKQKEKTPHPIDPLVKIVTQANVDSSTSMCSSNSSVSTDVVIDVTKKEVTLVSKQKKSNVKLSKSSSMMSAKSTKNVRHASTKTPVKITFEQKEGAAIEVAIDPEKKEITVLPKKKKQLLAVPSKRESPIISGQTTRSLPGSRITSPSKKLSKSAPPSHHSSPKKPQLSSRQAKSFEEHSRYMTSQRIVTKLQDTSDASTTYISPPTTTPGAFIDDVNDTRAMILELFELDPAELRRRAQEVSPVSSPETPSHRTMIIPSNMKVRNNKVNKNLTKFMSLIHAQTDTKKQTKSGAKQTQTKSNTTQTQIKGTTQTTARKSTMERPRTCNCRDPGCRLFHDKFEDVNQYTLKHCPQILRKYESLQQDCTQRIASLTDLIEKVRNEQRGVDLSIETSTGDSNTMARTQTIPSGPSTATSININQVVKSIESIHAQLKQTLVESQKIISQKIFDSSKSPPLAVTVAAREKSPSLDWSKDTLTNDSLEVSTEKTKSSATAATQQLPQQQSPIEKSKPKILNSEQVNFRIDRFRMSQDTKSTSTEVTAEHQQNEDQMVEQLSKEILEQSKSINKSVLPVDKSKDSDDDLLKSSQAPVKHDDETTKNAPTAVAASTDNHDDNRFDSLEMSNPEYVPLLAGIPKMSRKNSSNNGGRARPPVTLISGPYRSEIVSPVHELSTIVEFDTPDTVNKSQVSTRSSAIKCRKRLSTDEAITSGSPSSTKRVEVKLSKNKPSVHVAPLPPHRSPQSLNTSNKSASKSVEKSPYKSIETSLEKIRLSTSGPKKGESSDSLHTLPDVHIEELQQSQDNGDGNYLRVSQISELPSIPDEEIDDLMISEIYEEVKSKSVSPVQKDSPNDCKNSGKSQLSSVSSRSLSNVSGVSEISTTPSSDLNMLKRPTSPEDLEKGLKKLGLNWALATLKKTREASALGSSSSSDVTPINTVAARLVSPLKKSSHHESTMHVFPEVSDVSSISIKHANKSTDKSVLVKGRTSTPNRLLEENSETNSSGTISTLDSLSSDAIQVEHDQSAEHSIPNISFK